MKVSELVHLLMDNPELWKQEVFVRHHDDMGDWISPLLRVNSLPIFMLKGNTQWVDKRLKGQKNITPEPTNGIVLEGDYEG